MSWQILLPSFQVAQIDPAMVRRAMIDMKARADSAFVMKNDSGFLNIISNICHGLFDKRKFFLRHPVYIVVEVTMNSSQRPELPKNVNI